MKLSDIRDRCHIEDGHWIWRGAVSAGGPNIWAPDFTRLDGKKVSQRGPRAVWHVKTGKAIPNGWRVFKTCDEPMCVNPAHVECKPCVEWGKEMAESGRWKGNVRRIAASRATGRARSSLDAEKVMQVLSSDKSGLQLAKELGACRNAISRLRTGKTTAFTPVGGLFTGLLASNDTGRRAA